ncbi:Nramp family divalent metal transporter (plasmid) [Anabaena sp. FACHB-709]|uniref:Divalent metal cation transporter MntH n=3 Tax=Nostocaceae TaxID=1162 RepID=MNTH_NOSS1|nr:MULTISPECIES: Nramp family divalent metal transporter [Nostocaceae]Q8ZSB0.1 RecName: Full=Divalent metal cation transporter MntH [Nostoc sp. PCC 7120 = FACHB-418]BAY73117.1 manganese transport protein [Trichormus variabilis NIES-23]HBW31206.1 divalent metal cation transporter [Nostoc sp. UBA8866]MBD2172946.1 Nramp family divalent metal transporter [Anabaena cylindrica FACHB-318]MBD2264688.1 Nramp family divalent metal transporter [Anabaena sp. FACHB-709]MBD2273963.1 Nramp family divalent m
MTPPENRPSLPEVHRSIRVPNSNSFWRKMLAYAGPGYLVSVGYIDPGNWATDIAGGSKFGYTLLTVILLSNLMAILLQSLCVRLGVATGRDLAQACRDYFSPKVSFCLWVLCEIAIAACDLAELLGSAIALQLLFVIPLIWGVCITALDVLVLLFLQHKGFRYTEALVIMLVATVGICFTAEILFSRPDMGGILLGYLPKKEILQNPEMLYIAIGILGATVMPHNLYLHSSIVQTRDWQPTTEKRWEAIKFGTIDSTFALSLALFINSAILIVSAATFHFSGNQNVAEIQDAYKLLSPLLGVSAASAIFGIALLASGQSSTLTATLAGQIVMEGFLQFRLPSWLRRLITRLLAIIPALITIILFGENSTSSLIVLSQVILSLQLPFAVIPLVMFTSNRRLMGEFVNPLWLKSLAWLVAIVIVGLNAWLLLQSLWGWLLQVPS